MTVKIHNHESCPKCGYDFQKLADPVYVKDMCPFCGWPNKPKAIGEFGKTVFMDGGRAFPADILEGMAEKYDKMVNNPPMAKAKTIC